MTGRVPCAWHGRFETLARSDELSLSREVAARVDSRGTEQFPAWVSSLRVLRESAAICISERAQSAEFAAILEYSLPRDDRRPDVVVLENGTVVVIEFKTAARPSRADLDQVRAYARDLKHYQSACHDRRLVPMLVPLAFPGPAYADRDVVVAPPGELAASILRLAKPGHLQVPDTEAWLRGEYDPLPALTVAARALFERRPLPRVRRAASAGVPGVVSSLLQVAAATAVAGRRTVAFVTGVPGAGKTLVGLQVAHAAGLDRLLPQGSGSSAPAIFLSGNDPLVEVLQYALRSKHFVQGLKHYLSEHAAPAAAVPPENLIVFDEAQRAWDAKKVFTKHRGAMGSASEPEVLLSIADRLPDWSMVVALVGEGQEIHGGEESGLANWTAALRTRPGWRICAPPHLAAAFSDAGLHVQAEPSYSLDTSLRSHVAGRVHEWVGRFLDGDLRAARSIVRELEGWDLYVSRDLDSIRRYVRERYASRGDSRYGLLISSCAENCRGVAPRLKEDGVNAAYGPWYEGGRTARQRAGPNFCCSLGTAVSEFGCQGLELDFAVPCWGDDLSYDCGKWVQVGGKRRRGVRDAQQLRRNAYRVLLTRGRDGMCIYVPPEPAASMTSVFDACVEAGAEVLPAD